VIFAGTTVVISLLGMLLIGISFIGGLGVGAAAVVAVTMVASVTLLPALLGFVGDGPHATAAAKFDAQQVTRVFRNRGVRLANFGYFGHMGELYAMWTWAPVMIRASLAVSGDPPMYAEVASFVVIGAGAIGCVIAGRIADRVGRPVVAGTAMAISGACCIAVGFLYGRSPVALLILAAIWGATVVADSAQFAASVTELGDPRYVGTALTIQTCIGFLITTLLLEEWRRSATVALRDFYGRRARRLLPALFLTVGGVGVIYAVDPGLNNGISYWSAAASVIPASGRGGSVDHARHRGLCAKPHGCPTPHRRGADPTRCPAKRARPSRRRPGRPLPTPGQRSRKAPGARGR